MMKDDDEVVTAPLCRSISEGGHVVRVEIFRGPDTEWILEVVDASGGSNVWSDFSPTDQAALDEALGTIREEGLESLIVPPDGNQ